MIGLNEYEWLFLEIVFFIWFIFVVYLFSSDYYIKSKSTIAKNYIKNSFNQKRKENELKSLLHKKLDSELSKEFKLSKKIKSAIPDYIIYFFTGIDYLYYYYHLIKSIFNGTFKKWLWYFKTRNRLISGLDGAIMTLIYFDTVRSNDIFRQDIGRMDLSMFEVKNIRGEKRAFFGNSEMNMNNMIFFYMENLYKLERYRKIYLK